MNNKNKRNVGIIGLGYWGKNILRNLYEMDLVHTACDTSTDIIQERQRTFSDIHYTASFKDILDNQEIKDVIISTPAVTHFQLVKEALLAGKDVLVEKPLALNSKEGEELIKLVRQKQRILMVGHILQYHPAISKLQETIKNGDLGKIEYIYSNRLNIGKLRKTFYGVLRLMISR